MYSISKTITYDEHVKWFNELISKSRSRLYIITNKEGDFIGQIRYDLNENNNAVVSISISERYRGKGIATFALKLSHKRIKEDIEIKNVIAYIDKNNLSSIKLFENVGYKYMESSKNILKYIYPLAKNGE